MSLNVALKTATTGLMAAQSALTTVSDNISNVNTPGYVRKTVNQSAVVVNGVGMGVQITGVKRVTDQYLQLASLTASSDSARWSAYSENLDNIQALFGDPSSDTFFFNKLDTAFAAFASAADDPSSSLLRSQSLADVQSFLGDAGRINAQVLQAASTMDSQIASDVANANGLLGQIYKLNSDIARAKVANQDASGSENIQTQLIDQLSAQMNIKVSLRAQGGVDIRSVEGVSLVGDGAATLTYNRTDSTKGYVTALTPGSATPQPIQITGGEVGGLLDLRNNKLPAISDQLGEFVSRAVDQLNAAHNAASATPPPRTLTGRATGLDLDTAISGFTGKTTIAVVNSAGALGTKIEVDFDAGTMTVNGAAGPAFTSSTFLAALNTSLGAAGTASFTNGALSISATAGNGVAIDEGTSKKAGKAFSHFFGLNDLIKSTGATTYQTGLKSTDAHGFTPGQQVTLALAQPDGRPIKTITVTVPAGGAMSDMLSALNSSSSGVGLYGGFTLDANGGLSFAGSQPLQANLSVVQDTTERGGVGGPSLSEMFGLGAVQRSSRAGQFQVDPMLVADPTKLAFGKLDTTAVLGGPAVRPGDGAGALLLANAGDVTTQFQAAGSLGAVNMTVSRYASEFGGAVGREAADAETRKQSAAAVQTEATARRQSVEGVNLDEELIHMTTYQQAFNASARMIQAAKDLFDVLDRMF